MNHKVKQYFLQVAELGSLGDLGNTVCMPQSYVEFSPHLKPRSICVLWLDQRSFLNILASVKQKEMMFICPLGIFLIPQKSKVFMIFSLTKCQC